MLNSKDQNDKLQFHQFAKKRDWFAFADPSIATYASITSSIAVEGAYLHL